MNATRHVAQTDEEELLRQASDFVLQFYKENSLGDHRQRLQNIREEIERTGTYVHTPEELTYGAKVAWRNSNRCIGRLFWRSLKVRDCRHLVSAQQTFEALAEHIHWATNGGKIRSAITIFAPLHPQQPNCLQIANSQLIRYAAYATDSGGIIGDPQQLAFTQRCQALGWQGKGEEYDLLPLLVYEKGEPHLFAWPAEIVREVDIIHPDYPWFAELGMRWHALPVIADMVLEIGGIYYPAAPFNGYYMLTEIAARNLADEHRYNKLPLIAQQLGLDTANLKTLWKDRALLELNRAVLYSFQQTGVTLVDHHTAATQFMHFVSTEEREGRKVTADWAWIVPPMAAATHPPYHLHWDNTVRTPNYFYPADKFDTSRQPTDNPDFYCPHFAAPRNAAADTLKCPLHQG